MIPPPSSSRLRLRRKPRQEAPAARDLDGRLLRTSRHFSPAALAQEDIYTGSAELRISTSSSAMRR